MILGSNALQGYPVADNALTTLWNVETLHATRISKGTSKSGSKQIPE